ncbi:MAG: MFS transporter [Candidatus Latescibacterota bacterium]
MDGERLPAGMRERAFRLGVANGILFEVVAAILQPGTVLSAFFLRLTGSTLYATVPATVMTIGGLWPQLLASNFAEARPRKQPLYVATSAVRVATVTAMALCAYALADEHAALLVVLFPLLCFVYASASGAGGVAFMDIVGKTIPATRRGTFWGLRGFYGGILALGTGLLVRHLLGPGGPAFPHNYGCLFGLAAGVLVVSATVFSLVPEPVRAHPQRRLPLGQHLSRGVCLFRQDPNYRRLYLVGLFSSLAGIGPVVFVPFALTSLGLTEGIVGVLIAASTVVVLPANLMWSRMSDRGGNRRLYLISNWLYLPVPVLALLSALVPGGWAIPGLPPAWDLRAGAFLLAWVLGSLAGQSRGMAGTNYILELAPEETRPSYLAFMSVMLAPVALVPLLAGAVAEALSFAAAFALSLAFALVAHALIRRLAEPRQATPAVVAG